MLQLQRIHKTVQEKRVISDIASMRRLYETNKQILNSITMLLQPLHGCYSMFNATSIHVEEATCYTLQLYIYIYNCKTNTHPNTKSLSELKIQTNETIYMSFIGSRW